MDQVDADDCHIIRTDSIHLTHLIERIRADLIQQFVVAVMNVLYATSTDWKLLLEVFYYLRRCFAVPYTVASKNNKLDIFVEWFYDDVGKGCDHVIIQEPTGLGIFRWSQDFVIEVSNGS